MIILHQIVWILLVCVVYVIIEFWDEQYGTKGHVLYLSASQVITIQAINQCNIFAFYCAESNYIQDLLVLLSDLLGTWIKVNYYVELQSKLSANGKPHKIKSLHCQLELLNSIVSKSAHFNPASSHQHNHSKAEKVPALLS